jgi:septum formation protein
VTRCMAGPTSVLHANATFPGESGASRRSVCRAPGRAVVSGFTLGWPRSYHSAMRLILASASPRRAELLRSIGLTFEVLAADIDERQRDSESSRAYVRRLASEKSAAVEAQIAAGARAAGQHAAHVADPPGDVAVLAADTAVVVDEEVFGKPANLADWRRMLERLSGRKHEVITGLSLRRAGRETTAVESTAVFFSPLDHDEIDAYIETGEGLDKAGGYAAQGLAARFIVRIDGSYANVVGLPVARVYQWLRQSSHR